MVTCFPEIRVEHDGVCKRCTLGRKAKVVGPHNETKSKGVLDLLHLDICGPMFMTSITRHLYFATFIDDSSRKTWIYFLKTKDEVFDQF